MKFFNGFRKNLIGKGFGKYLLYAFGEIILVVIGILLAVSINNHYEKESKDNKTNKITQQIYNQMVTDSLKIHDYFDYLEKLGGTIAYYELPLDQRKEADKPLKETNKIGLFVDRDKDLLSVTDLVSTQIQNFDFSSVEYSQLLYNIQTDYNFELRNIRNQESVILKKNRDFNDMLAKKYDWYIQFSSSRNCSNFCINYINNNSEFARHLSTFQYEKTFIYKIRISYLQTKLRKHIADLKEVLN